MIDFLLKIKLLRKCKTFPTSNGMTYVELIVVLSIFSALSSVVAFNYGDFQARVDIKNLASDIASKVVEAQKSSLDGKWNSYANADWKPGYGVYFDTSTLTSKKKIIYFADLNNNNLYGGGGPVCASAECLDEINITKNNFISNIDKCSTSSCASGSNAITSLGITFSRPSSSAFFTGATISGSEYVQITIASPKGATALIKIYPSGRVQVN